MYAPSNEIYDTLSGICKGREEFRRTDRALQSLDQILSHIHELAQASHQNLTPHDQSFFENMKKAVENCVADLNPFKVKIEKWKTKFGKNAWQGRKAVESIRLYIKNSDLSEMNEVISKHVCMVFVEPFKDITVVDIFADQPSMHMSVYSS